MRFTRHHGTANQAKVDIQMTPMLDMIFQLLIFFILTFKPVIDEGQFDVTMSKIPGEKVAAGPTIDSSQQSQEVAETKPSIPIVVRSTANGRLAGIVLGERSMSGVGELQTSLKELVGDTPEEFEVALEVDERLKYEYVMQIINAISHSHLQAMSFGDLNSAP